MSGPVVNTPRNVLVVEDDHAIAKGLELNLRLADCVPTVARDGAAAMGLVQDHDFALVLLDINLPRKNGLQVLTELRTRDEVVPVIVVSARDSEQDKVAALRLGADDYVTKPFAWGELWARMQSAWRRAALVRPSAAVGAPTDRRAFGNVVVDAKTREVRRDGIVVRLTPLEVELVCFLTAHPDQVFSREDLLLRVWGNTAGTPRTVDNFVRQLRRSLEAHPEVPVHFLTVRGIGYRFRF